MENLQHISKAYLQEFLVGMSEYDTETLLSDLNVLEEYELCDMLLKKWPQLKIDNQ